MMDTRFLMEAAGSAGISLTQEQAGRFSLYASLLVEWNEKINLTAITDPRGIAVRHFVDSLTLLPYLPSGACSLIDIGTGAGFPGVPLAILRPDVELTLLDSLNKRLQFLKELCQALGIPATLVHARAEQGGRLPALREQFDVATAHAVAALPVLCEYCLPYVKVGGRFLAMKGPDVEAELAAAAPALRQLGGELREAVPLALPPESPGDPPAGRRLLWMDKIRHTPPSFPRPSAKIAKQPIK